MATASIHEIAHPANAVTIIELLHARWRATVDAAAALDEFEAPGEGGAKKVRESRLNDGEAMCIEEGDFLQAALLRQHPENPRDAAILAAHVLSVGDDIEHVSDAWKERACRNLERGLETLAVYLADQSGLELNCLVRQARRNVLMRQGKPEQDPWLTQVAS